SLGSDLDSCGLRRRAEYMNFLAASKSGETRASHAMSLNCKEKILDARYRSRIAVAGGCRRPRIRRFSGSIRVSIFVHITRSLARPRTSLVIFVNEAED